VSSTRWRFTCRYDGSDYHGWQRQPDVGTIQQILEDTLEHVLQQSITVHGAGRTDAGVHALGQVVHLDVDESAVPPLSRCQSLINERLPDDVTIYSLDRADDGFHARHDATRRYYGYRFRCHTSDVELSDSRACDVNRSDWRPDRARWVASRYDEGVPTEPFSGKGGSSYDSEHWSLRVRVRRRTPGEFWLLVSAPSFRYRMVRCLAGPVKRHMSGLRSRDDVQELLASRVNETVAPAPPEGCYLIGVSYETDQSLPPDGWSRVLACF
jgi:tRNA pseudouridine38-40 synthase